MLQGEHSAILSTFIKLPFIFKTFVMSIFERLFYTGFTVSRKKPAQMIKYTIQLIKAHQEQMSLHDLWQGKEFICLLSYRD